MTFGSPERLAFLALLVPLLLLCAWAIGAARRRRERLLGGLVGALVPHASGPRRATRDAFLLVAVAALVLAWAAPQWGTWIREVEERGVDVMIVLDTSRSMLAEDLEPSRLERAKREVRGLLDHLAGDRLGLVAFAGSARRLCPLTSDLTTLRLLLDDADVLTNVRGGTAVGEGLELALDALAEDPTEAARMIVLLTDGEDHDSDPPPTEIAFRALSMGIPIHVVAFGTAEGATIPVRDPRAGTSGVVRDAAGDPVITRPDESLLEQIASISGGAFLSAARAPFPLDEIHEKRIAVLEGVSRATSSREEPVDRFQWALILALACLGVRAVLPDGKA